MSFVTSIILIFSGVENEDERIKEVNSFTYKSQPIDLKSLESPNSDPYTSWYGGNKSINGHIYIGSYNYFEISKFIDHISKIKWEKSESVQLLIRSENEWNYNVYGNAGRELIYKSIMQ